MTMTSSTLVCLVISFAFFVKTRCRSYDVTDLSKLDRTCIEAHAWHCTLPLDDDQRNAGVTYKEWINDIRIVDGFPEPEKVRPLLKIRKDIHLTVSGRQCGCACMRMRTRTRTFIRTHTYV